MTYVFKHIEESKYKMIDAKSIKEAVKKLAERLSNGYQVKHGISFDSPEEYLLEFTM